MDVKEIRVRKERIIVLGLKDFKGCLKYTMGGKVGVSFQRIEG